MAQVTGLVSRETRISDRAFVRWLLDQYVGDVISFEELRGFLSEIKGAVGEELIREELVGYMEGVRV